MLGRIVLVTIVVALGPAARSASVDHCVTCHENAALPITLGHSFSDWRASPHGHADVGCEKVTGATRARPTRTTRTKASCRPTIRTPARSSHTVGPYIFG
jgi:hypothetical protein